MHPVLSDIFPNHNFEKLSGGDINEVFRLDDNKETSVIKLNSKEDFPEMFTKEAAGLKVLSDTFLTPKVLQVGEHDKWQFLQIEYFKESAKNDSFWRIFGLNLAKTHQKTQKMYGFSESNFIGSLVQNNTLSSSWEAFLIEQRLSPMIEMAVNSGEVNYVEAKIIENFYKRINEIYPTENPALLHGDLWSGNYISSSQGPVLIDPAVYFGHREMDIGMMHLFGGFDANLFNSYNEIYPLEKDWKSRISVNQLYPLLVHVNLFGRSYWNQVSHILKPFS